MPLTPLLRESPPAPSRSRRSLAFLHRWSGRGNNRSGLASLQETVLDVSVVVLSTWTVVYHLCLLLGLGVWWAVGFELGAMAVWLLVWPWSRRRLSNGVPQPPREAPSGLYGAVTASWFDRALAATAVVAGVAAAVLVAADRNWPLVSMLWLIAAVAATALASRGLRSVAESEPTEHRDDPDRSRTAFWGAVVALAWATALAALSLFARRPDPDDLYYINLSQWVVEHGTFPLRDTIFSDLVYPMSSWPPMASYDGLVGTLALLGGVRAASIAYLVVPPVATFLSVLALWRLLQTWRVRAVGVAVSLALVFLLFNGGWGYAAPGNLFLTRIWQGKVILLCLLVPTLLVYASRYVERPTAGRAGWLFAGGVAAVGLTTSAMFLIPAIALAGAVPLALRRPGRALLGFVAMAAYPLGAGVVTLMVDGRSADLFATRGLYRFDPAWFGPAILRDGPTAFVVVVAVLAGALVLPLVAARVTTGVLTIFMGVTFVPGVTYLSFDLVGLGPTLWRVSWIVPIAALVGAVGAGLGSYGNRRGLEVAVAGVVAVVLVAFGLPIWSAGNATILDRSPQWKRHTGDTVSAQQIVDIARPGDVVLAPEGLAVTITVMTTRVKMISPRSYFMDYLRDDPSFHYAERQILVGFAHDEFDQVVTPQVAHALTLLDVDMVCLPSESHQRIRSLQGEGYRRALDTAAHTCLRRA